MTAFLFLFLLTTAGDTLDSGGILSPDQAAYDTKDLHLALTVDPDTKTIAGTATLTLALTRPGLKVIELDLYEAFKVTRVQVNQSLRPFKRVGHKLLIGIDKPVETMVVSITYSGPPLVARNPPWDGGFNWSRTDSGQPWVGVSCQGMGGLVWFPCKVHPSDKIEGLHLEITVPKPFYCAANGLLEKIEPAGAGKHTFHWKSRYPISTYNISINIADYELLQAQWRGMPVILYMLREYQKADQVSGDDRDYAEKKKTLLDQTLAYLDFQSELFGEYPWKEEKLGIVHTDYKGMEHQTINSYGSHFVIEDGVDDLLLHELAHEWWGNKVSVADWAESWIHEGFATYVSLLWRERFANKEAAAGMLDRFYKSIGKERPLIRKPNAKASESFTGDVYYRGALVLHSLRYLVGDEIFFPLLRRFCEKPGYVTTQGFRELAEEMTGRKLDWFFQVYGYEEHPPALKITKQEGVVDFQWHTPTFNMPLEIILDGPAGPQTVRLNFSDGKSRLMIPEDRTWKLDPERKVYKRVIDKAEPSD
ncbi:MAG: M1 family metallopeptidase [Acidobacteriota bacterium]|nr:M1 family metallopeptidase [Acidobacteriota bacterium]